MNIEQIKAQIAEWERLDKERTQGEWGYFNEGDTQGVEVSSFKYLKTNICCNYDYYPTSVMKENSQFIAQAPAMFQAVKELLARVEELEAEKKIQQDITDAE